MQSRDARMEWSRREFVAGLAAAVLGTGALGRIARAAEWSAGLPARPSAAPLDFHALAAQFDSYIMDAANGVRLKDKLGREVFASAVGAHTEGGLTTYGPIALGRELRGAGLPQASASLEAYFSERYGLFLDGEDATLCEHWYLMNVTALAFALIRTRFASDATWLQRVRRTAESLRAMAHQLKYDFNSQGYDFAAGAAFTRQDIYRQPDAVGGYSYVMLLAWKLTGEPFCLDEAKIAMDRYLGFAANPWYEIPSGAMAVLAAARLQAMGHAADTRKALGFVLDSAAGLMASGRWGGCEVNGLMAGFRTEPAGQAYSMESMVTLPYLVPAVRTRPELATAVGRYALHAAANLRWFFPAYLPREKQSRPGLAPMIPYERLSREENGQSPYATGDFADHRSVYGGAYLLWLDRMVQPQGDPWLLRWDLGATDFLEPAQHPAYLYYNPWPEPKHVTLSAARRVRDLVHGRWLDARKGKVEVELAPETAAVLELETARA